MFLKRLSKFSRLTSQNSSTTPLWGVLSQRDFRASLEEERFVVVQPKEGNAKPLKFPGLWLRDNCCCEECFHQGTKSRRIDWDKFDTSVKVTELKADDKAQQLHIKWSDQHQSVYDLKWLQERGFSAETRKEYLTSIYRPKPKHWKGADCKHIMQTFDFTDVLNNDAVLQSWLEALAVYGVALIRDSPIEETVAGRLAERVGFIRKTTYGEQFLVQAKPDTKNYAYLSSPLPLHVDLPYYEYAPGANILHCLVQSESEGGKNLLVDAFHIADRLKAEHPDDYDVLTRTLVDWNDIGGERDTTFHNIWRAPVICVDTEGQYTRINHSIPQRDSHFSVPLDEVLPWYEAYAKFVRLAHDDAYAFKMKPGDVLTFNNIRLLHGRTGYDDTERNVRCVVGAYIDWDIIYSKLRILKTAQSQS